MAFDISTATPVNIGKFDISTAVPIGEVDNDPSFFQRLASDIGQRAKTGQEIEKSYQSGDTGLGQAVLQHVTNVGMGTMNDVVGEGIKSAASGISSITPDVIKDYASQKLHDVMSSDMGRAAISAAQSGGKEMDDLKNNHPNVYRDLTGAGNAFAILNPISKGASEATGTGVAAASDAAASSAKMVSRAALPTADEGLKDVAALAVKHNIPLSVDQISSSPILKTAQKVSQEVPFSGQEAFRNKQMSAFNSALLGTVGQTGTKITPLKMRQAFTKVGKEFDDLGAGQTFNMGQDFQAKVGQIMSDAEQTAPKDSIDNFQKALGTVFKNVDDNGTISGEKLNSLRSQINGLSRKANNQDTADLLHQLEGVVIDTMTSSDPEKQAAFTATKQRYKNLLAIEPLAAKAKAGNISPALLNDRVYKIYGRQHVIGQSGDIGDLARIGHELLPQLGGSDTTQKAALAALAAKTAGGAAAAYASIPATVVGFGGNRALQGLNRNQSLIKEMIKKGK